MVSSAAGRSRAVPMPMAFIPPRWAASIPAAESSKTRHCSGGSPRASAPLRNTSGLGLPFTIFVPSMTASKNAVISSFFRTNSAFLLTLPRAVRYPSARAERKNYDTPGSSAAEVKVQIISR